MSKEFKFDICKMCGFTQTVKDTKCRVCGMEF